MHNHCFCFLKTVFLNFCETLNKITSKTILFKSKNTTLAENLELEFASPSIKKKKGLFFIDNYKETTNSSTNGENLFLMTLKISNLSL